MAAPRENIVLYQGEDSSFTVNCRDANNALVDLSGYTAVSKIKKSASTSKSVSFDVSISPLIGAITLSMSANTSWNVDPGRYWYDCIVTDNHGLHLKVVEGVLIVKPGFSR